MPTSPKQWLSHLIAGPCARIPAIAAQSLTDALTSLKHGRSTSTARVSDEPEFRQPGVGRRVGRPAPPTRTSRRYRLSCSPAVAEIVGDGRP